MLLFFIVITELCFSCPQNAMSICYIESIYRSTRVHLQSGKLWLWAHQFVYTVHWLFRMIYKLSFNDDVISCSAVHSVWAWALLDTLSVCDLIFKWIFVHFSNQIVCFLCITQCAKCWMFNVHVLFCRAYNRYRKLCSVCNEKLLKLRAKLKKTMRTIVWLEMETGINTNGR